MILSIVMAALLSSQPLKLNDGPPPVAQAFELKRAAGEAAFGAEVDAAIAKLRNRAETTGQCATAGETAAAAEFELVRLASNPAAFDSSRKAAEAALAQRRVLRTQYLSGGKIAPPYGLVGRMIARSNAEPDPRLAALYKRMAVDQFSRIDSATLKPFFGPGVHTAWEQGLDDGALAYVTETVASEWCANDVANTAWLKADVEAHGWYKVSVYGAEADNAAWSLAQHARHDLAFQEEVLAMMEPLWQVGETRGQNYAALFDQIAMRHGRPVRFSFAGACTAPGVWTPMGHEDREAADAWRAKARMPSLAEDIATRSKACGS